MKIKVVLCLLALLAAGWHWRHIAQFVSNLTSKKEAVEIYAADMHYACGGCTTYRIERVGGNMVDGCQSQDYQQEEACRNDGSVLPGREFCIEFPSAKAEERFTAQNDFPASNLYKLKGYAKKNYLPELERVAPYYFVISEYRVITDEKCAAEWEKGRELAIREWEQQ